MENLYNEFAKFYLDKDRPRITALIFAAALILFLVVWLVKYAGMDKRSHDALAWVRKGPELPLGIGRRGKLTRFDIAPLLLITAVYAAAALYNLGGRDAPQTFWRAQPDNYSVLIDLGEPAEIESLYYYCGNFNGPDQRDHYEFALSEDGFEYRAQDGVSQLHSQTFSWREAKADGQPARYVHIAALYQPLELGELCVVGKRGDGQTVKLTPAVVTPGDGLILFDEQDTAPAPGGPVRTPLNGSYFDEIYHARAAYEFMNGDPVYETTHPPLGKEIIWAGVTLFGMTPFGWRIAGTVFGILMLPLFYLLLKQLFDSTVASAAATVVWAADFMHLTQTRIATIDTYNVFFVLLMFLFMHRWMTEPNDKPLLYTLPPLFLCGLSFGLGVASKWSSAYAGIGLVILYIWKLAARARESKRHGQPAAGFVLGTLTCSLFFFIAVPAAVYLASYIPYVGAREQPLTLQNLWAVMAKNQGDMFRYHTALKEGHPYATRWYAWLFDIRPICFYFNLDQQTNAATVINCLNNPALAWGGLAAILCCAVNVFTRRCSRALFILIGYLSVLLPWVPITRITFAYHYFPASMFLAAAVGYMFWRVAQSAPGAARKFHIWSFTAVSVALFAMFYPVLTGLPVSHGYIQRFLHWFPSWPF